MRRVALFAVESLPRGLESDGVAKRGMLCALKSSWLLAQLSGSEEGFARLALMAQDFLNK